jgi:hypothetical protein
VTTARATPSHRHARAHGRTHGRTHLAATKPKSTAIALRSDVSAARIPVPRASPQPKGSTADKTASRGADAHPAEPSTAKTESSQIMQDLIMVATSAAERMTAAAAAPAAQPNSDKDGPDRAQTVGRSNVEPAAPDTDLLVAIVMAQPDTRSISDLAGKTIAIDGRYSKSTGSVRTAIVAAGASEIQLSEGSTTAIKRLTNAEVPAAVVALVSPDAAEAFPDIAGFKTFQVPLSPRSGRAR